MFAEATVKIRVVHEVGLSQNIIEASGEALADNLELHLLRAADAARAAVARALG